MPSANAPTSHHPLFRATTVMGLPIFADGRPVWQKWLAQVLSQSRPTSATLKPHPALVMTPNAEQFVQASNDGSFWRSLSQADVLLPDGAGLVLATRLVFGSDAIAERLAGADVLADVLIQAKTQQLKLLVVGGRDYAQPSQSGHTTIQLQLPDGSTSTVDWTPGYFDIAHPTPTEHATVRWVINHLKPDIVLVAFGAPWQEAWAIRHQELLASVGTRLVMVIGGAMDFWLKRVPRAPVWMQQLGLEWLFRLVIEPWRWQRQLRLVQFVWLSVSGALRRSPAGNMTASKDALWRD